MLFRTLIAALTFGCCMVAALRTLPGGERAYWEKVRPVVSRYEEALSWSD